MYELLNLDEELKPYVNNFKLNLFDYHNYENFNVFKTENRLLFEVLSNASNKEKMLNLLRREKEYGSLDEESAKAILGIIGAKVNIEKIKTENERGEERYDMCKAFEDYKEEGRQEGERAGRKTGEMEMALKNVKNLMKNQKVTFEQAIIILEIPKEMKVKMKTLV